MANGTLVKGRDGVVRAERLSAGRSWLECVIQHLCPKELSYDVRDAQPNKLTHINPRARVFAPRRAAVSDAERIRAIAEEEEDA